MAGSTEVETSSCDHYLRKCRLVAPCCGNTYTCRICHDNCENHELDRYSVEEIICLQCETRQNIDVRCKKCQICFGNYTCLKCRMFDDRDRKQFHCDQCRICRIGGKENFFHCTKCDMCLAVTLKDSHKCVEKISRSDCPICLEDMHTSRTSLHVPSCGHMLHTQCYNGLRRKRLFTCPICCTSYEGVSSIWEEVDKIIAQTPMPDMVEVPIVKILCRDCHKMSEVPFHVFGLKCVECGSYNTCQD